MNLGDVKESDIGRAVTYRCGPTVQEGIISSVNERYVFVKFDGISAQACNPNHLHFESGEPCTS